SRSRPCLQYQIKRCTAPCVKLIDRETYQEAVNHVVLFLEGKNQQIISTLIKRMEEASQRLAFEEAALYRDQIASLRKVQEQQVIHKQDGNLDIIAGCIKQNSACVQLMSIRSGRLLGSHSYFPRTPDSASLDELLTAFISQYYLNPVRSQQIPQE